MNELDASESLGSGRLDLVPKEGFKVVEVSELAWLTDTLSTSESLMTVELEAVVHVAKVAHKKKECTYCSACPTFARVAVHDQHILRVS